MRFAAKEATLKSMGAGLGACRFVDIEVVRDAASGAPALRLHGGALELAAGLGIGRWHLSLSHTEVRASAFVVAEGPPEDAEPKEVAQCPVSAGDRRRIVARYNGTYFAGP